VFHVLWSSIAFLDEIEGTASLTTGGRLFLVKNFINDASFFDWDKAIQKSYFNKSRYAEEITVPRLREMAYEQVELPPSPSPPLLRIRAKVAKRLITRLFCEDMFGIGSIRCGTSMSASGSKNIVAGEANNQRVQAASSKPISSQLVRTS
jgi:hypothetical protein